jgi:hypothetical protein
MLYGKFIKISEFLVVQVREPDPAVRVEAAWVQRLRGAGQGRRHCQGQGPQHAHQPKESRDTYCTLMYGTLSVCCVWWHLSGR